MARQALSRRTDPFSQGPSRRFTRPPGSVFHPPYPEPAKTGSLPRRTDPFPLARFGSHKVSAEWR